MAAETPPSVREIIARRRGEELLRAIVDSGARSPAPLSSWRERQRATTTSARAATNAGSRPPVNSAAIDRPGVTEPIVMSTRLGGIVSDMAADEASTAAEALSIGLIGHVVPDGQALAKALEIAEAIAANGPVAVRAILRVIRETEGLPENEAFAVEAQAGMAVFASEDAREGPRAFLEKRRPEFRDR